MALHINKNRDNSSEPEYDDTEKFVPEWHIHINGGTYVINQQARSWGKTETVSNLICKSFT